MMKSSTSAFVCILLVPLMAVALTVNGCSTPDIEELKKGQAEILARIKAVEEGQKKLQEAVEKGAARKKKPQIDYNKVHNIPDGASAVRGAKDGKVTIVEFSDVQCPYCVKFQPLIKEILEKYPNDVRHVFKNFPLRFHKQARPAALALLAAKEQGKYWELQKLLFENGKTLSEEKIKELAGTAGLDVARFETALKSEALTKALDTEMAVARSAGVRGTPSIFVNGKRVKERSFEGMKKMIDEALKGGGK
ncbi:thioredoxin domain-containing protein [Thermodesulfobacteriota bacterium]